MIPLSSGFAGQLGFGPLYFSGEGTVIAQAGVGTHTTPVRLTLDGSKPPAPIGFILRRKHKAILPWCMTRE